MSALTRRRRPAVILTAALALTAAGLAGAFSWQCLRQQPELSGLDGARLTAELERLGYHVHAEPADREGPLLPSGHPRAILGGVYGSRQEPTDWEQVASRQRGDPREWRGCVLATRGGHPAPEDRSYLAAGPWVFAGDFDELDRIARALGLPR